MSGVSGSRRLEHRYVGGLTALLAALAAGLALACFGQRTVEPTPALLVITLDTTRADAIPGFGGDASALPNLASWSRESLRFLRAFSPAPVTLPAHLSLFSGRSPWWHNLRANGPLPSVAAPLELLSTASARGYRSAAFVGTPLLDPRYSRLRGFDVFDVPRTERDARGVVNAAVTHLEALPQDAPAIVWAHFFDAHTPYDPESASWQRCPEEKRDAAVKAARTPGDLECLHDSPSAEERRRLAPCLHDLYLSEVAEIDRELPRLREAMAKRGPYAWVVVADHGECLGEGDHLARHAGLLLDCAVHVPLFVGKSDGSITPGARDELVSTVDVAPTLAALMGWTLPSAEGRDLVSASGQPRVAVGFESSGAETPGCGGASWGARLDNERLVLDQPAAWSMVAGPVAPDYSDPRVRTFSGPESMREISPSALTPTASQVLESLSIMPPSPPPRSHAAHGVALPRRAAGAPLTNGPAVPPANGIGLPLANGVPTPLVQGTPVPLREPPPTPDEAARAETLKSLGYVQ